MPSRACATSTQAAPLGIMGGPTSPVGGAGICREVCNFFNHPHGNRCTFKLYRYAASYYAHICCQCRYNPHPVLECTRNIQVRGEATTPLKGKIPALWQPEVGTDGTGRTPRTARFVLCCGIKYLSSRHNELPQVLTKAHSMPTKEGGASLKTRSLPPSGA